MGQAIVEISNRTLKEILIEQKGNIESPKDSLNTALLILKFVNANGTAQLLKIILS
jgi:hypothetical protein